MVATAPLPAPDLRPGAPARRSALYVGTIAHRRHVDVDHAFHQPVLMAYLDLDEVGHVFDDHPLWSSHRPAPVRFRRRDMHGDPDVPLDLAVRRTVAEALGRRPDGPVRVLTHLRHWGWTFNPISLYYCFDATGTRADALLAEVTNTPWHERHAYVLALPSPERAEAEGVRFAKELHVSPFMDLDLDHVLRTSPPGAGRMVVEMEDRRRDPTDELVFSARLLLHRRALDRRTMSEVLRTHALPSHRVTAGIYRNALRLWAKGAPFRHHPHRSQP